MDTAPLIVAFASLLGIFGVFMKQMSDQHFSDYRDLKTEMKTVITENSDLRLQQHKNMDKLTEMDEWKEDNDRKFRATNDENARLSEMFRQSEEKYKQVVRQLDELQKAYDEFKAKSASDKRIDQQVIEGLRAELETAHRDAKRWHEQADKYETDWQQTSESLTRIEDKYRELEARLPGLVKVETDKLKEQTSVEPTTQQDALVQAGEKLIQAGRVPPEIPAE